MRHVEHAKIPNGWKRITRGKSKKGDMFLDMQKWVWKNRTEWRQLEEDDIGLSAVPKACNFSFLIRRNA